jgi:hypothetical protein
MGLQGLRRRGGILNRRLCFNQPWYAMALCYLKPWGRGWACCSSNTSDPFIISQRWYVGMAILNKCGRRWRPNVLLLALSSFSLFFFPLLLSFSPLRFKLGYVVLAVCKHCFYITYRMWKLNSVTFNTVISCFPPSSVLYLII